MNRITASLCTAVLACAAASAALAQAGAAPAALDGTLGRTVQQLAHDSARLSADPAAPPPRIEVEIGQLDPRLTLAPCQEIEPYLPPGMRAWGRTRVGLRCLQGPTRWNVTLPVTVKVFARSLVAAAPLPAGTVMHAQHLAEAEVDIAAGRQPALSDPEKVLGRTLTRSVAPGDAFHASDLRARQWFAAGETVQVIAVGAGFSITAEGQALGPGLEGQPARVRTESGRIVTGLPAGGRRVEVRL